jgi:hypothetical protein
MLDRRQFLAAAALPAAAPRRTAVAIVGDGFRLNGAPTYPGRTWRGKKVEGLLMNSRMVQATFDDRNPATRDRWKLPDGTPWDADRNTAQFVAALPTYRKHGLLAVTLNLQGGSPQGYSKQQPWHNSAFEADGRLRPADMARVGRVLDALDGLGMVAILGLFYFGQDERLTDEAAVVRGVDAALDWLTAGGWKNVLVEVNNECNVRYDHAILKPDRVHELIPRVRARGFLAGTSYGGGTVPGEAVVRASDFLLLHGNGVREPAKLADLVRRTRRVPGYRPMPVLANEDDHFDFDQPVNNFAAAVGEYCSWGYFDFRMAGEGFADGFQSVPVDWTISSPRKRGFFGLLSAVTGESP